MVRGSKAGPGSLNTQLAGKQYKDGINEVVKVTAVRPSDLDAKALALLDVLQTKGRSKEVCDHLKQALEGLSREKVQNWRGYVYTLLREFDKEAYASMKAERGSPNKRQEGKDATSPKGEVRPAAIQAVKPANHDLNQAAAEFVPGRPWSMSTGSSQAPTNTFNREAQEFVPGQFVWAPPEVPVMAPPRAASQKTGAVAQAKTGGADKARPKQSAASAPKAKPDKTNGSAANTKKEAAKASTASTTKASTQAAATEQPKVAEKEAAPQAAKAQVEAAVKEPVKPVAEEVAVNGSPSLLQRPGVLALGAAIVAAAIVIPLVQKRLRSRQ